MKVGFIVECGPQGAETKVIDFLAKAINGCIHPDIVTMTNKPNLKRSCGQAVSALLNGSCQKVIIVWDLLSDWGEYQGKGCLHDDRRQIFDSLEAAGLSADDARIDLVCIHKMLEAWLIADEHAVSAFLSTEAHPVTIKRQKSPERIPNPKAVLISWFTHHKGRSRPYVDRDHAIQIVKKVKIERLRRHCPSFRRFEEKLSS